MKPILIAILVLLISSCGKVQYLTVSNDQAVKNEQKDLVLENDTLKITYRFNGYPGPLTVSILNKSNEPIEIDWKKSSFILGEVPTAYYSSEVRFVGDLRIDTTRTFFIRNSDYTGKFIGRLQVDDASQFLPPKTMVSKKMMVLPNKKLKNVSFDRATSGKLKTPVNLNFKYKRLLFSPQTSPLVFRSFLTFTNKSGVETFMDHHFYISEMWLSKQAPTNLPTEIQKNGDLFCLQ